MVWKNKLSILVALIILYLSLANANNFDKLPLSDLPIADSIIHFAMYFGLMSAIIIENRKALTKNGSLLIISLIPLFYGFLMELLQILITTTRTGSLSDIIFNSAGILVSILIWLLIKPSIKTTFI
jgi:VanZ family protein